MTPLTDSAPSVRSSLRTGREKWLSTSMAALATVVTAALVWFCLLYTSDAADE